MRKPFLDDLRWFIILLVLLYHVVCFFNTCGAPLNIGAPGIPALDAVGYFCYPWFMPCLFLVAGVSARYSLEKRTMGQFLRQRARSLLLPLLASLLCIAPLLALLTLHINHTALADMMAYFPTPVLPLLFLLLMGMGPQWFLLELFLLSLLLPLARRLDSGGRLLGWGGRQGPAALLLLALPFWLCAQAPALPERHLLYLFCLLAGYFIFSHDGVQAVLRRLRWPLLAAALALFAAVLLRFWGRSFNDPAFLRAPLTTAFAWCAILAALGGAQAWLGRPNRISAYLRPRGFALYLFHYLPMLATAYVAATRLRLPLPLNYLLAFFIPLACCLLLYELLSRTPIIGTLFGLRPPKNPL